jgi:ABC-2 type transport system ATP-binding protein
LLKNHPSVVTAEKHLIIAERIKIALELTLLDIHKSYDTHHVLKGISFTARSGMAFGLLGRNGSGKTTTLRIIMDIFSPDSGQVLIDGIPRRETKAMMSYLPEERGLYPKRTVSEQMIYLGQLRGLSAKDARNSAEVLLERLEASQYFSKKLETLSKGNQQKIQLAIALLGDPDIVILDEPFSGLDPVNARIMKELVSDLVSRGKIILFSSHEMANVEFLCEDICIINHGKVVLSGNLAAIKGGYPRNKILLLPENGDSAALVQRLRGLEEVRRIAEDLTESKSGENKSGCIVTLHNDTGTPRLLKTIAEHNIGISLFTVLEPTLEEIFVEKAGDVHEAV